MSENYTFIFYENFLGVYRHSIPDGFTSNLSSLYEIFMVEGVIDVAFFKPYLINSILN